MIQNLKISTHQILETEGKATSPFLQGILLVPTASSSSIHQLELCYYVLGTGEMHSIVSSDEAQRLNFLSLFFQPGIRFRHLS